MRTSVLSPARWSWSVVAVIATLAITCHAKIQPNPEDWRVTSIIRTVELGGSVTIVSDSHTIRAHSDTEEPSRDEQVKPYYFAYSQSDASKISVLEVQAKFGIGVTVNQRKLLAVQDEGPLNGGDSDAVLSQYLAGSNESTQTRPHLYSVRIPAAFLRRAHEEEPIPDITLSISSLLLHTSEPLPPSVGQTESQFLLWKGDAAPIAVYDIEKSRVKVKASHPRILSFSTTPTLPSDQMTKSGTTVTFGPFEKLTSIFRGVSSSDVAKAQVHYLHDSPVVSIVEAKRVVTVSHWRKTMSVEDELWLRNDGAVLKGHFSRIDHQMSTHLKKDTSHILSNMVMHLPPGARDAYFVDQAGNVSTSKFRPAPPSPAHISTSPHLLSSSRASVLDLKPRYPVLGGWNYSFSVGWNVKLSDGWLTSKASAYSLQVPFMTPITDVAVDKASVQIILPEGASNVKVKVPFPVEKDSSSTKWHFLDTTGSPVIELEKLKCSERHGGSVTIEYSLSTLDHYRKVFVGVVLIFSAYVSVALLSKIDVRIKG